MKKNLTFLFLLFFSFVNAQHKQFAQWRFYNQQGADFKNLPPVPVSSQISYTNPGASFSSASVADDNGDLLFYTDGINVWDKNDLPMINGDNLDGFNDFYPSQRVIIVPKPGDPDRYYIFTIGAINHIASSGWVGRGGLHYTVVQNIGGVWQVPVGLKNIPLKNTNGDVIDYPFDMNHVEDNPLFVSPETRMTSALHFSGDKFWVALIVDFYFNHENHRVFMDYLVAADGINHQSDGISPVPNVESPINPPTFNLEETTCMKISPDGTKLCDVDDAVNLYPFDNKLGTVGNRTVLFDPGLSPTSMGWGADFSHDSRFVYYTIEIAGIFQGGKFPEHGGIDGGGDDGGGGGGSRVRPGLYQYAIPVKELEGGVTTLIYDPQANAVTDITPIPTGEYCFALQLARDNKIYVCLGVGYSHLGVIDQPWVQGTGCNFLPHCTPEIPSGWFLPQWVQHAVWPKVYSAKSPEYLGRDNAGNLIMYLHEVDCTIPNFNHEGVLPPSPNTGEFVFQYDWYGKTNWYLEGETPNIFLQSGEFQTYNQYPSPNTAFFDPTTGNNSAGPSGIAPGARIIAELSGGKFLTTSDNYNIDLFDPIGLPVPPLFVDYIYNWKFNPSTNKLFVFSGYPAIRLNVYQLNANNTFTTIASSLLPSPGYMDLVQIDNNDRVFAIHNNALQEYNYLTSAYGPPPTIINFGSNTDIQSLISNNHYTENRFLVYDRSTSDLISVDAGVSNPAALKIHANLTLMTGYWQYVYDGDDIFIAGYLPGQSIDIGNAPYPQHMPYLPGTFQCSFLSKFNLINDFQFRAPTEVSKAATKEAKPAFIVTLYPNPTNQLIKIQIAENNKNSDPWYILNISNRVGTNVLKKEKCKSGDELNIKSLETGIYYLEIINNKGERVGKSLIKL